MTADQLREFASRHPFEPFTIHMNDGSRLRITQPDGLIVPRPWKWNAIVVLGQDRFTILYLRNIAHISSRGTWPNARGKRSGHDISGDE